MCILRNCIKLLQIIGLEKMRAYLCVSVHTCREILKGKPRELVSFLRRRLWGKLYSLVCLIQIMNNTISFTTHFLMSGTKWSIFKSTQTHLSK